MAKKVEFINPKSNSVQLAGPDREMTHIKGNGRIVLDDWFMKYCPKHLRVIRILGVDIESPMTNTGVAPAPARPTSRPTSKREKKRALIARQRLEAGNKRKARVRKINKRKNGKQQSRTNFITHNRIIGKTAANKIGSNKFLCDFINSNTVPISNNIGIGILSYNRLKSIKRLLKSIRIHTDMTQTTVFVSDESDDSETLQWLNQQKDIILLHNKRKGIANNSNRLLRCLSRFNFGVILNDDVEILKTGWEHFYKNACVATGYNHFCYRQSGLIGAGSRDGSVIKKAGYEIATIKEKPHGAVMAFTHKAFDTVGFFDCQFGLYGLEHVDWSNRVTLAGLQPTGFHDVIGASNYFKINADRSTITAKGKELQESRQLYNKFRTNKSRIRVPASNDSLVRSVSVILAVRDLYRSGSINSTINNIRAQKFPNIEIVVVENDHTKKLLFDNSIKHVFVGCDFNKDFQKSKCFNVGVGHTSNDLLLFHDADLLVDHNYLKNVCDAMSGHDSCHIGELVIYLDGNSTSTVNQDRKFSGLLSAHRSVAYFEGGSVMCRKKVYWAIGGFNEAYEGYGCEDCDFFNRLKTTNFNNNKSETFIHLDHPRAPGWSRAHEKNKRIRPANIIKLKQTAQDKYKAARE